MYKLLKDYRTSEIYGANKIEPNTMLSFLFDPANSDYAQFKKAINEGAELQDAEGNVMTAEQAQDFIKELP
jgi:hypothetical protein